MIRVSIVGSTGYTGGELLRYLIRHPEVSLAHLTSESFAGKPIHQLHKFLTVSFLIGTNGTSCKSGYIRIGRLLFKIRIAQQHTEFSYRRSEPVIIGC